MNNSFGFTRTDLCFKSSRTCIHQLVECVSKGGNYLLNVGPDARGNIPPQSVDILSGIAGWMRLNAESIYGCGQSPLPVSAFGCRATAKDRTLYLHVMEQPVGPLAVTGISPDHIKAAYLLATGAEIEVLRGGWAVQNYPDTTFLSLVAQPNETMALPDEKDTVIVLELF